MVASMENATATTNSNATTATTNNSHKGEAMETATTNNSKRNSKASNSNSNSNSKRNASKRNSKASNATTNNTTSLPSPLPARCIASYNAQKPMDATTEAIFRHHLKEGLAAYGGTASICQLYNFLRGDSPLRREKDGSQKVDGLPLWSGLGSSLLFRAFTEGTYLTYTHKPTRNGKLRSVAVAGPLLQGN